MPAWGQGPRPPDADNKPTISVRELSIPESARKNYALSRSEIIAGKPACALSHLRKAIAEFPGYYEAHNLLGVALLMLKKTDEAEAALHTSVSLSAERFAPSLVSLATLYSDLRRFAEAEPFAAQAIELDDSLWYAHYELARARFRLGRAADALPAARVVAREQPDYARGRLLLALIHANLRGYEDALAHLDAYLRLAPDAPDHAHMLRFRAELAGAVSSVTAAAAATSAPQP